MACWRWSTPSATLNGCRISWVLIGLTVPVLAYAPWSGTRRTDRSLQHQVIGMIGFGAVAAVALGVSDEAGAYLVAAGLLGHAVWDGYH